MTKNGEHAVVLGASMAGLLAARVLTETHARVTIIERDELPHDWASREGVPQGRHTHGIHPRGAARRTSSGPAEPAAGVPGPGRRRGQRR